MSNLALLTEHSDPPRPALVNQFSARRRMRMQKSMSQMFAKTIAIFLLLSASTWMLGGENRPSSQQPPAKSVREAAIEKAVAKMESRHFELHSFYIPPTQGNLQWIVSSVGAKPGETLLVWKLMRDWEARKAVASSTAATAAHDPS